MQMSQQSAFVLQEVLQGTPQLLLEALTTGLSPMSAETGRVWSQGAGEVDHCNGLRDGQTVLGAKFQDYAR